MHPVPRSRHRELVGKLESVVKETAALLSEHQAACKKELRDIGENGSSELVRAEKRFGEALGMFEQKVGVRIDGVEKVVSVQYGQVLETIGGLGGPDVDLQSQIKTLEELITLAARRDDVVQALGAKADKAEVEKRLLKMASLSDIEAKVTSTQPGVPRFSGRGTALVSNHMLRQCCAPRESRLCMS